MPSSNWDFFIWPLGLCHSGPSPAFLLHWTMASCSVCLQLWKSIFYPHKASSMMGWITAGLFPLQAASLCPLPPPYLRSFHVSYRFIVRTGWRTPVTCTRTVVFTVLFWYLITRTSIKESYFTFPAVHEKIFMVFMFGSLSYMLATIKVFKLVKPNMSDSERNSYLIKKCLFATSIVSTVGLCVFFLKHRLLCHDMGKSVLL